VRIHFRFEDTASGFQRGNRNWNVLNYFGGQRGTDAAQLAVSVIRRIGPEAARIAETATCAPPVATAKGMRR
jgi:hypothetical protein